MSGESKMPSKGNEPSRSGAFVQPLLVARGISKFFPGVVALDDVDFEIRPGEVNALVGENGAGKSTLIKIMAGFYTPDRGEIRMDGKHLSADPAAAHKAGVATIHQDHHLVPNMTVAENIMLGHWPSRFGVISRKEQTRHALQTLSAGGSGTLALDIGPPIVAGRGSTRRNRPRPLRGRTRPDYG